MADEAAGEALDGEAAVDLLRQQLPEFAPTIDEHREDNFGELLFHLLMGDLARFYVSQAVDSPEVQRRFWMVVDRLAVRGDSGVQNAIGVSLIEWFAWGDDRERATLVAAKPLMSSVVRAITDEILRAGGFGEDGHPRRPS
jgi:hypothetical protein